MKVFSFIASWIDDKADLAIVALALNSKGILIDLLTKSGGRFIRLCGRKEFSRGTNSDLLSQIEYIILSTGYSVKDVTVKKTRR